MQVILTGATGFIGSNFAAYLVQNGVDLIALGRKPLSALSETRQAKLQGATYLSIDMREISKLPELIARRGIKITQDSVFFNMAWGGEKSLSDLNIAAQLRNVAWSVSALEAASILGCTRFLQVGSMEEAFAEAYLNLDHHKDDFYNRHVIYAVAKMAARDSLAVLASRWGMNLVYILHSHVMGPDDDKDSFLQVTLQKLIHGEDLVFSSGEQLFDVVSLGDCCLGYYLICQKGRHGRTYWVGSGQPCTLREYVERMYRLYPSGKAMQFGRLPYRDVTLKREVFSTEDLVRDTGFAPNMTFEQTVAELYNHLVSKV